MNTNLIATSANMPQLSPILASQLAMNPYPIHGYSAMLALYKSYLDTIIAIGITEHSGDWDPWLKVTLNDGTIFETVTGYPDILIGDFSDEEQDEAILYYLEITNIGFHLPNEDNEEEPIIKYYPLTKISTIQLILY